MEKLLSKKISEKEFLLGNEAIVRGAIEAGVSFVTTYPGTPASEIGDTFFKIKNQKSLPAQAGKIKNSFYFEYSTNEKVALEAAAGASFSGLRSLIAMKNFGLNVASDFLMPLMSSGVNGGLVIVVADDVGCSSSAQFEEDSRPYSYLAYLPILEPATPQECKDFTKFAFEFSEKFKIPIMIRTTTRIALASGIVKFEKISEIKRKAKFVKNPLQFSTMPPRVLEMHRELIEKIKKIQKFLEKNKINKIESGGRSRLGIITSGISYLYVREALKELNLDLSVLKLGFVYPLPEKKIANFIKKLQKVLVVEELQPYLEREIKRIAQSTNCKLQIFGKNLIPEVDELRPEIVTSAIAKFANLKLTVPGAVSVPFSHARRPQFCPGCPYWLVFGAIKRAVRQLADPNRIIFGGEIGCYMLAFYPPIDLQDYLYCMGSGAGVAHGISKATKQKIITFIGDSSFFHAGIPALINTVFNKSNPLIIILDNQTTAMTGHQPHPGAPTVPNGIKIENIVSACGVKNLAIIDPIEQEKFIEKIKEFLNKEEVSVIIARRPCIFVK
ncbi:indolepyruvate ferredoxin oxidoreductase subunit alpha [bacterium (Candidatus Gribaldobacteria) CG_4_9_14_3_um_filter_33_9]|nr:MAG: indolepyruvate ferredoxin oxidoreductase subunit alpha [bacterium (Candidatus Gribaldobacteria) CG_4_9_14_3_um_filter_33_9]